MSDTETDKKRRDARDLAPLGAIFVGAVAARNLAARGDDRPLRALDQAKKLKAAGASEARIYAETSAMLEHSPYAGVSYGADGKARFEISDHDARISPAALDRNGRGSQGNFLKHEPYYRAHPDAAMLDVFKHGAGNGGYSGTAVFIGDKHFAKAQLAGRTVANPTARGVNLHELQHHAQAAEGFAAGGSPRDFEKQFPGEKNAQLRFAKYYILAGEVEAENTRARSNLTPEQRRAIHPMRTQSVARSQQIVTDHTGRVQEMADDGIKDFGEKIGGARKDRAVKTGPKGPKPVDTDTRPGWQKRFIAAEKLTRGPDGKSMPSGQWTLLDTRTKGYTFGHREAVRQTFPSQAAAEQAIPLIAVSQKHTVREQYGRGADGKIDTSKSTFEIWRRVTDRKSVKAVPDTFASRDEALKHMVANAERLLGSAKGYGEEILAKPEKVMRSGDPVRKGDVVPEQFLKDFKFRGVEFGNWQGDRQQVMNHAYDAMHDLAKTVGVAPEALTFNQRIALAFGARGNGGKNAARAHYERDYGAINLTKTGGAGTLAHEWWHAADHYLATLDDPKLDQWTTNKAGEKVLSTSGRESDFASHRVTDKAARGDLNPAVREAYRDLVDTMLKKPEQVTVEAARFEKQMERASADLKQRLADVRDDLARQKTYGSRNTAPATAAQLAEFDRLAAKLLAGEDLATKHVWNDPSGGPSNRNMAGRYTNDTLEAMSKVLKEVRGRAGFDSQNHQGPLDRVRYAMTGVDNAAKLLADAKNSPVKTVMTSTDFVREAVKLDGARTSSYWNTRHELAARAFTAYIEDKLAGSGRRSDYLSFGSDNRMYGLFGDAKPFPEGAERAAINAKFDKLFDAMRQTEVVKPAAGYVPTPAAQRAGMATDFESGMKAANEAAAARVTIDGKGPAGWSDEARAKSAEVRAANAKPDVPTLPKSVPPPEVLAELAAAGRRAHAEGRGGAPAQSPEVMKAIGEGKYDAIKLMDAYAKAWTAANASTPVQGVTDAATKAADQARADQRFKDALAETDRKIAEHKAKQAPATEVRKDGKRFTVHENGKPILDSKGQPKWFGSKDKADVFLARRNAASGTATAADKAVLADQFERASAANKRVAREEFGNKLVRAGKPRNGNPFDPGAKPAARPAVVGDNGGPSDKALKTAAKLESVAKRTIEAAQAEYDRPRLMNTARRARLGSGVQEEQQRKIANAKTALKIAEALRNGEAGALAGKVESLADVERLSNTYRAAMYNNNAKREQYRGSMAGVEPDVTDIKHAKPSEYVRAHVFQSDIPKLRELLKGKGVTRELDRIERKVSKGGDYAHVHTDIKDIEAIQKVAQAIKKHVPNPKETWKRENRAARDAHRNANMWLGDLREFQARQRLGLTNQSELHATLEAFAQTKVNRKTADPVAVAERDLIGRKLPGFFPTPQTLAERMASMADIKPGMQVLEPSAGTGRLADAAKKLGANVDTVEMQSSLRDILAKKGHNLIDSDFTSMKPEPKYDRIVMNPPFEKGQDIEHVRRAYEMLKPGGKMVAVMGEGAFFRGDKKAAEFRNWLESIGSSEKLPDGTFKESNTGVNTRLVTIEKPAGNGPQGWSDAAREASAEARGVAKPGEGLQTPGKAHSGYANPADRKPAPSVQSAVERAMAMQEAKLKAPQQSTLGTVAKPVEAPVADTGKWLAERDERIKASKAAGNQHLDALPRAVEGMRGTPFRNVHDPKERGVVRTVANTGDVVVDWADQYSADKNLANVTKEGKKDVRRSWLAPSDLKDYVAEPKPAAPSTASKIKGKVMGLLAPVAIGSAAIVAMNESAKAGESKPKQVTAGAVEAGKGAAVMGGFMAATVGITKGLMKAGMTAAKAVPATQGILMAGGAVVGAVTAKPGERLKGAARGAWDMSLPGAVVGTVQAGKAAIDSTRERMAAPTTGRLSDAQHAKFKAANDAYDAMQDLSDRSHHPGWSNAARIEAAKARGAVNLPYGGNPNPAVGQAQWITPPTQTNKKG